MAHGVLQRGTGDLGALRHRGATPGGGGLVGPERGDRRVPHASQKGPAEPVRAGRARGGARRKGVGAPPNREGECASTNTWRRAGARGIEPATMELKQRKFAIGYSGTT